MPNSKSAKDELLEKLNELLKRQSQFQQQINALEREITQLNFEKKQAEPVTSEYKKPEVEYQKPERSPKITHPPKFKSPQAKPLAGFVKESGISTEIEQFIGTNLINKIGMIVVIIGVGIGAKYAIDNDLISPLVRIILGYLVGAILTFVAIRLKKQYFNFSAVLFSGSMTVYYYITYAAYIYYGLYSGTLTFILMVVFTVLTVALALFYDRQVIAHFGLVGAYLVPFLVGNPDSSVVVLFTYMVIINAGILFIATKKRWKPLNYLAFTATWIIYLVWFLSKDYNNQITIALTFSSLFFAIFYLVLLSYKLILKEKLEVDDIFYLLLNAGIFYSIGMVTLSIGEIDETYNGLFTAINAIVHGFTAFLIYKYAVKNNLLYWTLGIVVVFTTVAIALQFNDYITAILWAAETAFLFRIGRSQKIKVFDYISFTLISILFLLTAVNWVSVSYNFRADTIETIYTPVFNMEFLASLAVITSFSFIYYTNKKLIAEGERLRSWVDTSNILFPVFFLIILFFTFYTEIDLFWNNIQLKSSYALNNNGIWVKNVEQLNRDIFSFKAIWLINYSLLFTSILAFINFKWIKNTVLNAVIFVLSGIMMLIFLGLGFESISQLRESYLSPEISASYTITIYYLLIRYICYLFIGLLFYSIYRFSIRLFVNKNINRAFEIILSISIIWICSSELINWLSLSGSTEVYKYGLSILWGILSFVLIGYGIWKKKKHLRITSIVLFAGTVIKLFIYDITQLDTIQKTIVFLSIGAILLIVSYIYNKYRDLIFGNN